VPLLPQDHDTVLAQADDHSYHVTLATPASQKDGANEFLDVPTRLSLDTVPVMTAR
jgi:hypothetical protein